jgi:hypothetical protein
MKARHWQEAKRFTDIVNVGPATSAALEKLGFGQPTDLQGQDAFDMHARLEQIERERVDPCVIDVFLAVIDFMEGAAPRPWWHYTPQRKRMVAARRGLRPARAG